MELQPNMYVRLNCNYELGIGKTIREIDEDNFVKTKFKDEFECSLPTYMIKKASHNIIDIIEVGDYVNGKEVKHIAYFEGVEEDIPKLIFVDEHRLIPGETCENDDIKSVVTKEMFSSVEYRVE